MFIITHSPSDCKRKRNFSVSCKGFDHMKTKLFDRRLLPWSAWAFLGIGAGFLNGLLGAAGGVLLLTLLPHMPPLPALDPAVSCDTPPEGKAVFVTGLWVMLPVTVVSAVLYYLQGIGGSPLDALIITLPAALGGILGAMLLGKLPVGVLRGIFGGLVLLSGIRMLLS